MFSRVTHYVEESVAYLFYFAIENTIPIDFLRDLIVPPWEPSIWLNQMTLLNHYDGIN
jgi:hypothetical protein